MINLTYNATMMLICVLQTLKFYHA